MSAAMSTARGPLVILLDVDGTLVGDVVHQVVMYEIGNSIKTNIKKNVQKSVMDSLQFNYLLRPGFKCFFEEATKAHVEIFIYTAAEKKWAEYIIKCIEQSNGIKFNRPILSRDQCINVNGELKKSINLVRPTLIKALKRKYKDSVITLENSILAVDNNPVFIERDFQLLCSTYDISVPMNIPQIIPLNIWQKEMKHIQDTLIHYYPNYKATSTYMKFEKQLYEIYVPQLSQHMRMRSFASYDPLFKCLKDIIASTEVKRFTPKVIHYINKKYSKDNNEYSSRQKQQSTFF